MMGSIEAGLCLYRAWEHSVSASSLQQTVRDGAGGVVLVGDVCSWLIILFF